MPMWPFGRRRRDLDAPQPITEEKGKNSIGNDLRQPSPGRQGGTNKNSRGHSRRKKRRKSSPRKGPRRSEENKENEQPGSGILHVESGVSENDAGALLESNQDLTALPMLSTPTKSPHLRPVTKPEEGAIPYNFSLNHNYDETTTSPLPTRGQSKAKRPKSSRRPDSLLTQKSKRQSRPDSVREEEIRAMSASVASKRPLTFSGSMLQQDIKKMRGGLNKNFERPMSEVSLPMEDSIHSSMSGGTDLRGFKISAMDLFSARPKLRLSASVQLPPGSLQLPYSPPATPNEAGISRRRDKENRIGELADDMDASSLREMMERDARRRAKKKQLDEDKLRRRLERRAEKQRAKEARAKEPRKEPESGTLQRREPPKGLAIAQDDTGLLTVPNSTKPDQPDQPDQNDDVEMYDASADEQFYEAPEELYDIPEQSYISATVTDVADLPPTLPPDLPLPNLPSPSPLRTPNEEPVVSTAQAAVRYSRGSVQQSPPVSPTHNRNPSNISHLPDLLSEVERKAEPDQESIQQDKRSSGASSKRFPGWSSILRRVTTRRRSHDSRATPSEASFSNASRESMTRQPLPPHLVDPYTHPAPTPPLPARSSSRASGVPQRNLSKFREDLPELPLSPPDSRVQSPEAGEIPPPIPPISARRGLRSPSRIETERRAQQMTPEEDKPARISESPNNLSRRTSGMRAQSMASVDSEGSWLSGKPVQRGSRQRYGSGFSARPRNDDSGSNDDIFESANESGDEEDHLDAHDAHNDEYFQQLSPTTERRMSRDSDAFTRKPSSNALGPSATSVDDELEPLPKPPRPLSGDEILHTGIAKTPTVVWRQSTARVKSSEGLVNLFEADDTARSSRSIASEYAYSEHAVGETPDETQADEAQAFSFERAKSIDLNRNHARQVSAGSARLLNIKRVSSINAPPSPKSPRSEAA